jgi:hypothetical protein
MTLVTVQDPKTQLPSPPEPMLKRISIPLIPPTISDHCSVKDEKKKKKEKPEKKEKKKRTISQKNGREK